MSQQIFAKEPVGGCWNAIQRLVAVIGVGFFVLASLVPPWKMPESLIKQRVWGLLFDPPMGATEIDWLTLAFEWFIVLVATVILVWVFRSQREND